MREDERIWAVKELLFDYVKSPSLRHIRDPHSVTKLAQEIVKRVDRGNSIWRKWDGQREIVLKSAVGCWIRSFPSLCAEHAFQPAQLWDLSQCRSELRRPRKRSKHLWSAKPSARGTPSGSVCHRLSSPGRKAGRRIWRDQRDGPMYRNQLSCSPILSRSNGISTGARCRR
jgi:hypothetical protein